MTDTEAEKQTALSDCHKCKYAGECKLLEEWIRQTKMVCKMGVK